MNWSRIVKEGNYVYFRLETDSTISRIGRIEKVRDSESLFRIVDLISCTEDKLESVIDKFCYPIAVTQEMLNQIGFKERGYDGGRKQLLLGSFIVEETGIIVPPSKTSGQIIISPSFYEHDFANYPISAVNNIDSFLEEKRIFDVNDLRDRLSKIGYQLDLGQLLKDHEGSFSFLS